jgi:hypothetical protein
MTIIALFYNESATVDILESKRRLRVELAAIENQSLMLALVSWGSVGAWLSGHLKVLRDRIAVRIRAWRSKPSEESLNQCLNSPEFEFMKHLHILTQRMAAWRAFPDKQLPKDQLPAEFVEVKGALDAPHSEYEHLCCIQEMADAFIPADMQRTLFAMMLSEHMDKARSFKSSRRQ